MPGYVIHLAIGEEYLKRSKAVKSKDEFLKGIIAPDLRERPNSHYGKNSMFPDLNMFLDQNEVDDYNRGYFLHLITDYFFYNKYLVDFEWSPSIYDDYDKTNEFFENKYDVKIPDEIRRVVKYKKSSPQFFEPEGLCDFIELVARMDIDELRLKRNFDEEYDVLSKGNKKNGG